MKKTEIGIFVIISLMLIFLLPQNVEALTPPYSWDNFTDLERMCFYKISDALAIGKENLSPRMQIFCGTSAEDVKCNEGLKLIFKSTDFSPACVKGGTFSKLYNRGWGHVGMLYQFLEPAYSNQEMESKNQINIVNAIYVDYSRSIITTFEPLYVKAILNENNTVTWFNTTPDAALLTDMRGLFNTTIGPGESFDFTFETIGEHVYDTKPGMMSGTVIISTMELESLNLEPVDLLKKDLDGIANKIAQAADSEDEISMKRLDNPRLVKYETKNGGILTIPKMLCLDCRYEGSSIKYVLAPSKSILYPVDETKAVDYSKKFLESMYSLDGSEIIEFEESYKRHEVSIKQQVNGFTIKNQGINFHFDRSQQWITIGRWYEDLDDYRFKILPDKAKKIAFEHMDRILNENSNLQQFEYKLDRELVSYYTPRFLVYDDKPMFEATLFYEATSNQIYENDHCGSPQSIGVWIRLDAQKGHMYDWGYLSCE